MRAPDVGLGCEALSGTAAPQSLVSPEEPSGRGAGRGPSLPSDPDRERIPERFGHPIPRTFFERPTATVARELVGALLVRRVGPRAFLAARLLETEAYVAGDPANHAFRGPGLRNWTMFSGPGHWYVYRIHQVHCANVTTAPGEAVLLRAAEPIVGDLSRMGGPGLLCRAFGLARGHDGGDAIRGALRILPGLAPPGTVRATPRSGIREGRERLLRFVREDESHPRESTPGRPKRPLTGAS